MMTTKNRSKTSLMPSPPKTQRRGRLQRKTFINNKTSFTDSQSNKCQTARQENNESNQNEHFISINKEETYFSKDSASPSSMTNMDLIGTVDIVSELKAINEYYQFNPANKIVGTEITNQIKAEDELAFNHSLTMEISHNSSIINCKDNEESNISDEISGFKPQSSDHDEDNSINKPASSSKEDMDLFKFGFHCMDIFMESALDLGGNNKKD